MAISFGFPDGKAQDLILRLKEIRILPIYCEAVKEDKK